MHEIIVSFAKFASYFCKINNLFELYYSVPVRIGSVEYVVIKTNDLLNHYFLIIIFAAQAQP